MSVQHVNRRQAAGTLAAGLAASVGQPAWARQTDERFRDSEIVTASRLTVLGSGRQFAEALRLLSDYGQPDILPTLILAMRYNASARAAIDAVAQRIAGESGRSGWFDWMLWQQEHPEITPHPTYRALKVWMFSQIDPQFLRFLNEETTAPGRLRIRLEEITWGGVRVDGIPALDDPKLITARRANYLKDDDLVFGVEINRDARAYPLRILDWHEMFNDVVGGVPVALAYCTLCGAGILFETQPEGRAERFLFGSSGFLYRSNKLMFDRGTDSLWNQFTGAPVSGPLVDSGFALTLRPVVITSWKAWRDAQPRTRVLSLDTGHRRDYGPGAAYGEYFASEELMFPALADSVSLRAKDYVFGVRVHAGTKAWPLEVFRGGRVLNDVVEGGLGRQALVLIGDAATRTVRAYERGDLTFSAGDAPGVVAADGASWRITEAALVAEDGRRAPRVAGHIAYWFAWNGYLGLESQLYMG